MNSAQNRYSTLAVEEKYRKQPLRTKKDWAGGENNHDKDRASESSTDSEEEDDEGVFASEKLDAQIQATLQAIRSKDPRVYDERAIFYTDDDEEPQDTSHPLEKKSKPMYLSDYHRRNLLEGGADADPSMGNEMLLTYSQQQDDLRETIVREMHATVNEDEDSSIQSKQKKRTNEGGSEDIDDADSFLKRKVPNRGTDTLSINNIITADLPNPHTAEKDPEGFLSNFLSARAWVPSTGSNFQPFESDDDDDDERAEAFEAAFNLRFEDPKGSNEKLLSHARDAAARYSVRKEPLNSRKKSREVERADKEANKREREKEKARLRKLRIAEAEEKIQKIKDAAGLRGDQLEDEDWITFLDDGWDDNRWEEEMRRRFGEDYYADQDFQGGEGLTTKTPKIKKPKWQDDIDIKDLIPNFEEKESNLQHRFTLADEELDSDILSPSSTAEEDAQRSKKSGRRIRKQIEDSKNEARRQRRKVELHVDKRLNADETLSGFGTKHAGHFRYRETSPLSYGLTAHDILMATDSQLNQYTGLKKMATFRDAEKKRKDKKRLGKKARLRQWRKETFGDENGPQIALGGIFTVENPADSRSTDIELQALDGNKVKKQRMRSKRKKAIVES